MAAAIRSAVPSSKVGSGAFEIITAGAAAAGCGTACAGAFGRAAEVPCAKAAPASIVAKTTVAAASRIGRVTALDMFGSQFRIRHLPTATRVAGPACSTI
jgi:hypothetical protein